MNRTSGLIAVCLLAVALTAMVVSRYHADYSSPPVPIGFDSTSLNPLVTESGGPNQFGGPNNHLMEVRPDFKKNSKYVIMDVFYGTNREATGDDDPEDYYGGDLGKVTYGTCRISIPHDHRMGELESPDITSLEFSSDPEYHVTLMSLKQLDRSEFFKLMKKDVAKSDDCRAFLFVHGYNVSFEDAARRTGQMAYDLSFDGAPVFYSWPSQASLTGYGTDEEYVDSSRRHLKSFIRDFIYRSGAEKIFIIAHSMGNRAVTGAVMDLAVEYPWLKEKLTAIILAAPDIDATEFRTKIAPKMADATSSLTLYASSNDNALLASKAVHGNQRAGDTEGGMVLVNKMTSIDASSVETSLMGHSYYAESKSILSDIYYLIRGLRPQDRFGLVPASTRGDHWKFKN